MCDCYNIIASLITRSPDFHNSTSGVDLPQLRWRDGSRKKCHWESRLSRTFGVQGSRRKARYACVHAEARGRPWGPPSWLESKRSYGYTTHVALARRRHTCRARCRALRVAVISAVESGLVLSSFISRAHFRT